MARKRKVHAAAFKAQVALAALKQDKTINEQASQHGLHPTLIHRWKKHLLAGAEELFSHGSKTAVVDYEARQSQLYEEIGRLKMELDWVDEKGDAAQLLSYVLLFASFSLLCRPLPTSAVPRSVGRNRADRHARHTG